MEDYFPCLCVHACICSCVSPIDFLYFSFKGEGCKLKFRIVWCMHIRLFLLELKCEMKSIYVKFAQYTELKSILMSCNLICLAPVLLFLGSVFHDS